MYKTLAAPAIGIKDKPLAKVVALAKATGYAGVDYNIREAAALAKATAPAALKALFESAGVKAAAFGLPVEGAQSDWIIDLAALDDMAALAASLGTTRCATWVPSWNDTRDLAENRAYHITQLRPAAAVLARHGISLGLEFLGPKTLRDGHKFGFIWAMGAMLDMAAEIGPNVGLLLDAWHLYTSGGTLADLAPLTPSQIVVVHINDAPKGVPIDTLMDNARHLPLETGGIDLEGFMRALARIGYDGPVVTEPFNAPLNALAATDPKAAAAQVSKTMSRLWAMSDLG